MKAIPSQLWSMEYGNMELLKVMENAYGQMEATTKVNGSTARGTVWAQ